MELQSLNSIFTERIFRIPDYQRGYAWTIPQLEDYWEDLMQLDSEHIHYTGVLTLEPVSKDICSKWEDEKWLINDLGYKPFYIVDGQQRLTTSMILIQAITESVDKNAFIASQAPSKIIDKFIMLKADDKLREGYIFGYEKDNPSDDFLKTEIFGMYSSKAQKKETLYTRNLKNAKDYFKEKLSGLSLDEINVIYKKLTQKFKFNLYVINDEIDVFVTFETMNNRGKALSNLELLKNRLIYLSTLFRENAGKDRLRSNINEAWKTVYEYLGKNPDSRLSDDVFLRNHWIMYFKYSRKKGDDYIKFLLDEKFNARNITHPKTDDDALKISEISDYVISIQKSVIHWFHIHNPYFDQSASLTEKQKKWLDKLNRLGFRSFRPLILSAFVSNQETNKVEELLEVAERYNFTLFNLSQRRSNTGDTNLYSMARDLLLGSKKIDEVIQEVNGWVKKYYDSEKFLDHIIEKYKFERNGFYHWDGIRYFLYEHEQDLTLKGKQVTNKLSWELLKNSHNDSVTLEHIFPQTPTDPYWTEHYGHLNDQERWYLTHSLGNLLPLSRKKNSSIQNASFPQKKNDGKGVGYYNGSASENEVNTKKDWTPYEIKERGLLLLTFMEQRWRITLGDDSFKEKLLHINGIDVVPPLDLVKEGK